MNTGTTRIALSGISATEFQHPTDRAALAALRKAPGLDLLFRKLSSVHFERQVRLYFTASCVRLTPKQCGSTHRILLEACEALDVRQPDLYLWQNPHPNAMAIGMDRYTIVVTTGLLDLLDDDELRSVLGHELGHIKCGHMLYRTIAIFLGIVGVNALRSMPFVDVLSQALLYALYDWSRKSELSADRAALLTTQDPDASLRVMLKLAGGGGAWESELSVPEFIKQADDYEEMEETVLDLFYKFEMTRFQSHPFPAIRAREMERWSQSDHYARILRGEYETESAGTVRICPKCGLGVENPTWKYCPDCGACV